MLLLACIAAINLLVDPFRVFGTRDVSGMTAFKPDFVEHLRLTTPYAIRRARPAVLLLGTSRVGRGLSPDHAAFQGRSAYNAALPAVSIYEAWRILQHANAVNPLEAVVLGIDNRMFYADTDGQGAFSEARLAVNANGLPQRNPFEGLVPDYAASLISTDALLSSLRTLRFQGWARLTLARNGQWVATTDEFDTYHGFRAMTRNTFDRYRRYAQGRFDLARSAEPLRAILRLCHREAIDLRMFIPPAHAWHWEAMRLMNMTARFDDIRREIVRANAEVALEFGRQPFPIVDFSGYQGPSTMASPTDPAESPSWFFESVHFTPALGDVVLQRLLTGRTSEDGFGISIETTDMESYLAEWHAARERYASSQPREVHLVQSMHDRWLSQGGYSSGASAARLDAQP